MFRRVLCVWSLCALWGLCGVAEAQAQGRGGRVVGAKIGNKFATVGFSVQPGLVRNPTPETPAQAKTTASGGMFLKLGVSHLISSSFVMSGELDLGMQWLDEHPMNQAGVADSERAFAWQVGMVGRWVPSERLDGWSLGGGLHLYRGVLADVSVQMMAAEVRTGWLLWRGEEQFALVELGYALPLISGLSLPSDFSAPGDDAAVEADWTWHRLSMSVQVSF